MGQSGLSRPEWMISYFGARQLRFLMREIFQDISIYGYRK
jgi:hypothetical protein